jgi:integrase
MTAPALRLIRADGVATPTAELTVDVSLTEFFHRHCWPACFAIKQDQPNTHKDYRNSLRHWADVTGDPPLWAITHETCQAFVKALRKKRGLRPGTKMSPNTVFKHVANVQRLLDLAGPASRNQPDAAALLQDVPWFRRPRRVKDNPRPAFRLDELWRWLEVLPKHARPMPKLTIARAEVFWRIVIVVDYNSGMRPQELFGARWEHQSGSGEWQKLPPGVAKGHDGREIFLNAAARAALDLIKRPRGLIFGWEDWPAAHSTLRRHRIRLQEAAGIPQLPLYGLRRTFSTQAAVINPLAMQLQMGHEAPLMQMAADHYINREVLLMELEKLPQPGRATQQSLF